MNYNRGGRGGGSFPRSGSSGNIPPANRGHPVGNNSRAFPRAYSSGNVGVEASVVPGTSAAQPVRVSIPNPDPFPDDEDDDIWGGSELDHIFSQLVEPVVVVGSRKHETTGDFNRNSAADELDFQRQLLAGRSQENGMFPLGLPNEEESLEELRRKLAMAEEEKKRLKDSATALEGETKNLRNLVKSLKAESQDLWKEKYDYKKEAQQQKTILEKEHNSRIGCLEAEVKELQMELTKEKMARSSPRSTTSILNTSAVNPNVLMDTSTVPPDDPADSSTFTPIRIRAPVFVSNVCNNSFESSPIVTTTGTSEDDEPSHPIEKLSSSKAPFILEEDRDETDPSASRLRNQIFLSIQRVVDLRFQLNLPSLESIVKKAPKEVMRRLLRPPEDINAVFPDVVDFMFLWGVDRDRKKVRESMRLPEPPRVPPLPRRDAGGWEDLLRVTLGIEVRMTDDGVWGGLIEVREALEELLRSVEGSEGRVKLYERPTLGRLWKLLAWAEELWQCVVLEEEGDAEIASRHMELYTRELEGWTGLVLKTDWRDFLMIEVEAEVRRMSLSILASIVAAGYFEQKKKRYVILGRILSDVLTLEAFAKDPGNLRNVLKILTFSIGDLTVLKFLCHRNNEGNCIAKLLGEYTIRTLKSSEVDDAAKSLVYFDYLSFLETLMRDKPLRLVQSDVAWGTRKEKEVVVAPPPPPGEPSSSASSAFDCSMDIDSFVMSQFACPIKYSSAGDSSSSAAATSAAAAAARNKTEQESLRAELKFWLDPTKYEDPFGSGSRCQCRRSLVAGGVIGLQVIFELWQKAEMDHEKYLEEVEATELEELERLEEILSWKDDAKQSAVRQEESVDPEEDFHEAVKRLEERCVDLKKKRKEMRKLEGGVTKVFRSRGREGRSLEWNWNDVIQRRREVCGLLDLQELPEWTVDLRRPPGILEECLCTAAFFLSFIETRSDNVAAAMGSEAYKVYSGLVPLLRSHLDRFNISQVDKGLLISVSNECDNEGSSSSPLPFQSSQLYQKVTSQDRKQFQRLPDTPSPPIYPLETLTEFTDQEMKNFNSLAAPEIARLKATVVSEEEDLKTYDAWNSFHLLHCV